MDSLAADPEQSPIAPMEAKSVAALPTDDGWQFEPKWDGFRCLAFRSGDQVRLFAKSGKPLHRFFPEVVEAVRAIPGDEFVLDGELVIPLDGALSFDALGMRLHPAETRIRKLARETPALLVVFDLLVGPGGKNLVSKPLIERRTALARFLANAGNPSGIRLSPFTRDVGEAQRWLDTAGGDVDGVVAKRLDGPYESGERAMVKVKPVRTADCVVGGFRYGKDSPIIGSLLLGLYDEAGLLNHVGFVSGISTAERKRLTPQLEALAPGPGFTGDAPGGPSRWSTERSGDYVGIRHELVVEVGYSQVTSGRFRHGSTLVRWRPDKAPDQCTYEQIAPEAPSALLRGVIAGS